MGRYPHHITSNGKLMLTSAHVGQRVVVRRVVGQRAGRPLYTDVIGELSRYEATELVVRDANGTEVAIPHEVIVAAKPVPPRPPRRASRASVEVLERAAAAGWPASHTEWIGDWLLRATGGWSVRGNTALVLGDPGVPLHEALDRTVDWYAGHGIRPGLHLPRPLTGGPGGELAAELGRRGWPYLQTIDVLVAPVDQLPAADPVPDELEIRLADRPDEPWLAAMARARGAQVPDQAVRLLTGPPRVTFVSGYADGRLVAIGRGAAGGGLAGGGPAGGGDPSDSDWTGVSGVEVVPEYRRRGFARLLMSALAGWAAEQGTSRMYLQVQRGNEAAAALYRRLGFQHHHEYVVHMAPAAR